jgi:hypothetical protein
MTQSSETYWMRILQNPAVFIGIHLAISLLAELVLADRP